MKKLFFAFLVLLISATSSSADPIRLFDPAMPGEIGGTTPAVGNFTSVIANIDMTAAGNANYFLATNTVDEGEFNAFQARGRATATGVSTAETRGVYARATTNEDLFGGTVTALQTETIAKDDSTTVNLRGAFIAVDSEGTPTEIENLYGAYIRTKTSVDPTTDFYGLVVENELFAGGSVADAGYLLKGTGHFVYGFDFSGSLIDTADIRGHEGEIIFNDPNGTWGFGAANLTTTGTIEGETEIITIAEDTVLTVAQCRNTFILVTGAHTVTMPDVSGFTGSVGGACSIMATTAAIFKVDVYGTDLMSLYGTNLHDGDKAASPGTKGARIIMVNTTSTGWEALRAEGNFTDDGA